MKVSLKCAHIAAVRSKSKHIRSQICPVLFLMQCQMDSFRLVKYKMSHGRACRRAPNMLLRKRHNAAPGMVVVSKKTKQMQALPKSCGFSLPCMPCQAPLGGSSRPRSLLKKHSWLPKLRRSFNLHSEQHMWLQK